jgi:hypothetical protein
MKKDLYNSKDEEYQHVIKLLREIPKESAPDNFEYNLSVKIENKIFDLNTKESSIFHPWKILMPAAGVVVASLLLFFTIFSESDSLENPFQIKPQLRNELSGNLLMSSKVFGSKNKINENDVVLKKEISVVDADVLAESIVENKIVDAKTKENKTIFPFDKSTSTNLDDLLDRKRNISKISRRAILAGRSNSHSSFNGFYIREEVDKDYVEALKARNDSLKKAMKVINKSLK